MKHRLSANQQALVRSVLALLWMAGHVSLRAESVSPEALEFFEKRIRPVLVEYCHDCHSSQAEKVRGGLLLDTRAGLLKGGESGPALVPGNPASSLLIRAVHQTDEKLRMPPKEKKLSPQQIADLEEWVRMGAPDPRTAPAPTPAPSASPSHHWAFQPVARPAVPAVRDRRWVQTPVDAFILTALESKGIPPSPKSDRRTLIRRLSYDLTGLPPSPDEVEAFRDDPSPDAYARLVERLLASPRYGERWGRHWLDVARYADTKGYVFEEERRYPYAYTYRDYVIRAFNEDLPYNRFLIEQIAADQLSLGEDRRALAAMGFLTLGRRFLNNPHDIIDDRLDVVGRGLMGLTLACSRCHDHKYDPIPIQDYYSLYGVFASSSEPSEKPLLGTNSLTTAYPDYLSERKRREDELSDFRMRRETEVMQRLRAQVGDYLLAAEDTLKLSDPGQRENLARERKLDPRVVQRWRNALQGFRDAPTPITSPWLAFATLPADGFAAAAATLTAHVRHDTAGRYDPLLAAAFDPADPPASLTNVAAVYNRVFADIDREWLAARTNAPAATGLPDGRRESLRAWLYGARSPLQLTGDELFRLFDTPAQQKVRALKRKVEELDATHPGSPPRGMVLVDNPTPVTPRVFVRGNPSNPGSEVPRQFLSLLAGPDRKPFTRGSGRLELAEAIASRDNPLTARVLVNRVWQQHFGAGLVRTPGDFGLRSDPPTHPELLDWLAARFMDDGWSIKKLHRLIVLSSTYQQRSDDQPAGVAIDPNNTLLWRMNRRRLDFEATRDTLLLVSGQLDTTMFGLPCEMTTQPFTSRRTVYGFVERQNLPGIFRTFDFASPDTSSAQRFQTTVPQQALFMINSPFAVQQARSILLRPEIPDGSRPDRRIKALYRTAYQRKPEPAELELGRHFLEEQSRAPGFEPEVPAWRHGFGTYDAAHGRVTTFTPLPVFTNNTWQAGATVPDEQAGWVMLTATGGHPGKPGYAAIRRWIAPRDLVLQVSGAINHDSDKGDGVRARIISSNQGELASWVARKSRRETRLPEVSVRRGETLDFVVECIASEDSDTFTWAPVLKAIRADADLQAGRSIEWNARQDFSGPKDPPVPLNAWEKYAQVLLMSNELVFID